MPGDSLPTANRSGERAPGQERGRPAVQPSWDWADPGLCSHQRQGRWAPRRCLQQSPLHSKSSSFHIPCTPAPPPDEVGALVFDIGSFSVRAGYAGEDCPKVGVTVSLPCPPPMSLSSPPDRQGHRVPRMPSPWPRCPQGHPQANVLIVVTTPPSPWPATVTSPRPECPQGGFPHHGGAAVPGRGVPGAGRGQGQEGGEGLLYRHQCPARGPRGRRGPVAPQERHE